MRQIAPADASRKYGISTLHTRMANNELRFRLMKKDGTGYIRTEAPATGGWQESHFHSKSKETYIVQDGWIAYAVLTPQGPRITIHEKDDQFTTEPMVRHNIYRSANSVVHTVKHGVPTDEDRMVNDETRGFDDLTHGLKEDEIVRKGSNSGSSYSEEYRHFDSLIWQLPAWSTGLFVLAPSGLSAIFRSPEFGRLFGISTSAIVVSFLGVLFLILLALSHVLYRFRWHQVKLRRYRRMLFFKSGQFYLQLIVTGEACGVLLMFLLGAFNALGWHGNIGTLIPVLLSLILLLMFTIVRERGIRKRGQS